MLTDYVLNILATHYKSMVDRLVINHAVEINKSDFVVSQVSGNVYELTFDTPDGVSQIEYIQVLDASGNAIADKRVFVPVEANVRFKTLLTFKNAEG